MNPYQQNMYGVPGYGFRNPMYNAAPQTPFMPQQMTVTPVTGMAQVEAAQVSFDGTPSFFYNTAQDALYIKQFNPQNGTSPIATYCREAVAPSPQYATVEMVNALAERLDVLTAPKTARRKDVEE